MIALFVAVLTAAIALPAAVLATAPALSVTFVPGTIALGDSSSLNFAIVTDEVSGSVTGLAFSNSLPAGLSVANTSTSVCGGTLTTTSATNTIALSGGSLPSGTFCPFSVAVTGAAAGSYEYSAGPIASSLGTGTTANGAPDRPGLADDRRGFRCDDAHTRRLDQLDVHDLEPEFHGCPDRDRVQ